MNDSTSDAGDVMDRQAPDESASGESERVTDDKRKKFPGGIGLQIYLILLVGALLTLGASLVAYFSFGETMRHATRLAEYSMPNLINSVGVARQSAVVVGGAFRMLSAGSEPEHDEAVAALARERASLESIIGEMESRMAFGERTHSIRNYLAMLDTNLDEIRSSSRRRLTTQRVLAEFGEELADLNRSINGILEKSLDDQGFYLVEGLRNLDDVAHPIEQRASEEELTIYRNLASLNHQTNLAVLLLDEVMVVEDRQFLPPLQDRFHSAMENIWSIFAKLSGFKTGDLRGRSLLQRLGAMFQAEEKRHFSLNLLNQNLQRLGAIGEGGDGIIPLRREALQSLEDERNELAEARIISDSLVTEVNNLVAEVNQDARSASAASRSSVRAGVRWLIIINLVGVVVALLFAWLFVGRYLLRRLIGLAEAMRRMADGDLKAPIKVGGNDEVTDMARALEVFRRNAEEVQRLNLVEKLAAELDARNASLERAMQDLKKAQEQIVAEQKLASLGQLAAGVAHEIKNPLNFISNFSTVIGELVDEIEELIEDLVKEEKEKNPDAFKEDEILPEVQSIFGELRLSLGKILDHGKRANGIVQSMLEQSRSGEGEWREVDLNALLKQYVELAYHSLRAEEPGFNLAIKQDLEPDLKPVEVIPQDISRVFLNLATNACQAINEKRLNPDKGWQPEIVIRSQLVDDHVRLCIRDNGTGIPKEMQEKIFQPFVTTKPAGQGTGLGLSLTSDVMIRHRGSIELSSEEGSFTELCILLPLQQPKQDESEEKDTVHDEGGD